MCTKIFWIVILHSSPIRKNIGWILWANSTMNICDCHAECDILPWPIIPIKPYSDAHQPMTSHEHHRHVSPATRLFVQLLNLRIFKCWFINEIHIFHCMGNIFCGILEFRKVRLKSTQNILPIHWKKRFSYNVENVRALQFTSSYAQKQKSKSKKKQQQKNNNQKPKNRQTKQTKHLGNYARLSTFQ